MNLVDVVNTLGDKHYSIGRPIYFEAADDEQQFVQVHAHPVLRMGAPERISQILQERNNDSKGIAIAYGGFIGIDMAAAHDAEGILLLDINPDQKKFWRSVIDLIKESPTAASFREKFSVLSNRYQLRQASGDVAEKYPSFIDDEDVYKKVHDWAIKGMMASTDMDVLDTDRHQELAGLLQQNVGMIFLTNVPYFYNKGRNDGISADSKFPAKTTFYSGAIAPDDYALIFQNQKILAGDNTKVIYCDHCTGHDVFPLKEESLGAILPRVAVAR